MRTHQDVNAHIVFTALIQASLAKATLPRQAAAKPVTRRLRSNETDDRTGSNRSRALVSHDMAVTGANFGIPKYACRFGRGDPVLTGSFEVI